MRIKAVDRVGHFSLRWLDARFDYEVHAEQGDQVSEKVLASGSQKTLEVIIALKLSTKQEIHELLGNRICKPRIGFGKEGWTMPKHLGYKRRNSEKLEARRIAAMARLRRGESTSTVSRSLGVSIQSVQRWARAYRLHGNDGLRRIPKSGPHPKLAREKLARLPSLLARGPIAHGFETPVWTSERIALLVWRYFRVRYSADHVKRLLPSLGWSWHEHTWLASK